MRALCPSCDETLNCGLCGEPVDNAPIITEKFGDKVLYEVCPDCNGNGSISVMAATPLSNETEYECLRCQAMGGLIQVWPVIGGNE